MNKLPNTKKQHQVGAASGGRKRGPYSDTVYTTPDGIPLYDVNGSAPLELTASEFKNQYGSKAPLFDLASGGALTLRDATASEHVLHPSNLRWAAGAMLAGGAAGGLAGGVLGAGSKDLPAVTLGSVAAGAVTGLAAGVLLTLLRRRRRGYYPALKEKAEYRITPVPHLVRSDDGLDVATGFFNEATSDPILAERSNYESFSSPGRAGSRGRAG